MLALGQLAYLFNCRFLNRSSLTPDVLRGNPVIWWSSALLVAFQVFFTYTPFMHDWFATASVGLREWGLTIAFAVLIFLLVEAGKAWERRRARASLAVPTTARLRRVCRVTITVRRSRPDDHEAILALMDRARGVGLSDEERARRGFVQGRMTAELLDRFQDGPGVFVADAAGELAGFAITSEAGGLPPEHPASAAVTAVVEAARGRDLGRMFLYGPVAVDDRFQGRGVLTRLITALSRALRDDFDLGSRSSRRPTNAPSRSTATTG